MGRRLIHTVPIWTVVCLAAAGPSLYLSSMFPLCGRLLGIAIWIAIYAIITARPAFARRWDRRPFRVAMIVAYGLRMGISVGMLGFPLLALADMYCGIGAINLVEMILPTSMHHSPIMTDTDPGEWLGAALLLSTTLITVLQGLFLSILTFVLMLIVWSICRAIMRNEAATPRGFDVLAAAPVLPVESR